MFKKTAPRYVTCRMSIISNIYNWENLLKMNSLLALTMMAANFSVQASVSTLTANNFDSYNSTIAQQTCGMIEQSSLESSFPVGSIVNDGYSNYKVLGYSPSFGAVRVIQVDSSGNQLGQTAHWVCANALSTGTV